VAVKIYTGKGDMGQTSIWGGVRMDKDSPRLEVLGQVDACSADIGVAIAAGLPKVLVLALGDVQDDLYIVGCELMAPDTAGSGARVPRLTGTEVERLERLIDDFTARMPELKNFIHPGGTPGASQLHVARTTCRSTERRVHSLSRTDLVSQSVGRYLNLLADILFTAARFANHDAGVPDRLSHATER